MANKLFYLNGQPLDVEISPVLAQTLDETIDNITITLKVDKRFGESPLDPLKNEVELVQVYDDDSIEIINKFVISADNVQLATENPLRFKHQLTLVQRAQKNTKKEMRNTVFSTSLETSKFSITSGRSYILRGITAEIPHLENYFYRFQLTNSSYYEQLSSGINGRVDLSKKKIYKMSILKNIGVQIVRNEPWVLRVHSEPDSSLSATNKFELEPLETTSLNEILQHQNEQDRIEPSIVINVYNNNVLIDSRNILIGFDNFNNNVSFDVPSEICEWLRTFSVGYAEFVFNLPINLNLSSWDSVLIKENKVPFFYYANIQINFEGVEKSCYEVIQTLLNQQLKETADYNRTNDPTHYVPLFQLPTLTHNNELYELLTKTSAPNFVFTQGNMYEILVEIFKLFDAIFTIDNDGYLDIEYYNEQNQHKIEFEEGKKAGRQSSLGEERYANRLISYYQNTKIKDRFPNSNQENATAYLRSKTIGVPRASDFVFLVNKPIDIIQKAFITGTNYVITTKTLPSLNMAWYTSTYNFTVNPEGTLYNVSVYVQFVINFKNKLIDITQNVNEKSIWSILSESMTFPIDGDYNKIGKYNSLFYERGTPYIYVSDYYNDPTDIRQAVINNVLNNALHINFGLDTTYVDTVVQISVGSIDWHQLKMAIEYISLADGKLVNESINYKFDGGMIINQNNGSIDINKLGLNMVGLSLKLGQPTLTMTQKICKWEDRVKKGDYFIKDGARWVANTCNYTLINKDLIEASIEFVKNFNGLASRIELNREKRLSNISNDLTVKCEETYGEYIYFSDRNISDLPEYRESVVFDNGFLQNSLAMGFGYMLVEQVLGDLYNATNDIINSTIASFNPSNYKQNKLIKITGYVVQDIVPENTTGLLILNDSINLDGNEMVIPYCASFQSALRKNVITGNFEINYSVFDLVNPSTEYPYSVIAQRDQVDVLIITDGVSILGGVVIDINVTGLDDWFDYTKINQFVPRNDYTIEYASLDALDENGNVIQEDEYSADHVAIPLLVYGSGMSVCFEMSFDSPIAAGTQLVDNYTSVYASGGWFSKYVLYAAKDGTATKFTIDFIMLQEELTRQFPKLAHDNGQGIATTPLATYSFGKIREFAYYKKPNEIFALNYQLHFLPFHDLNGCFLSNEYIKNNGFANGLNKKPLHIVYTTRESNFEYSILDTKGEGTRADITATLLGTNQGANRLDIGFETGLTREQMSTIKTWALVDDENNIYFASNNTPIDSYFYIHFLFMHHRKEEVEE